MQEVTSCRHFREAREPRKTSGTGSSTSNQGNTSLPPLSFKILAKMTQPSQTWEGRIIQLLFCLNVLDLIKEET